MPVSVQSQVYRRSRRASLPNVHYFQDTANTRPANRAGFCPHPQSVSVRDNSPHPQSVRDNSPHLQSIQNNHVRVYQPCKDQERGSRACYDSTALGHGINLASDAKPNLTGQLFRDGSYIQHVQRRRYSVDPNCSPHGRQQQHNFSATHRHQNRPSTYSVINPTSRSTTCPATSQRTRGALISIFVFAW